MSAKTEPDRDFDAFMAKLPQWAQTHVHELQHQIGELQRQVEVLAADLSTASEGATVWLSGVGHRDPDRPLNGGPEKWPGQRQYTTVRFGHDPDRSYEGLRVKWADNISHSRPAAISSDWIEVLGDGQLEIRCTSSNLVYVRQVPR